MNPPDVTDFSVVEGGGLFFKKHPWLRGSVGFKAGTQITRFLIVLAGAWLSWLAPVRAGAGGDDRRVIENYLLARDFLTLAAEPGEVSKADIFGEVDRTRVYLRHALERDAMLGKLFARDNDRRKVLPGFLRYFAEQAREYERETGQTLVHYRVATRAELKEGREAYRDMKKLIRALDKQQAEILGVSYGKLFGVNPERKGRAP